MAEENANPGTPARRARAATGRDARALAIRDHLVRLLGVDPSGCTSPAAGFVEANTSDFRLALWSGPRSLADLAGGGWPHRLGVWTALPRLPEVRVDVLTVSWRAGAHRIEHFRRGPWEGDALSLRLPPPGR